MSTAVRVTILFPEKTRETFAAPQTHGEVHLSEMILFHHGIVKCLSSSWLKCESVANVFFVVPTTISIASIAAIIITLIIFA